MSELIRKINPAKWKSMEANQPDEIPADAVTICMRTTGNTLSVWAVESLDQQDEAALALVTGQSKLETIFTVNLPLATVEQQFGISLGNRGEGANTPVVDLVKTHFNLVNLTYTKLGPLAGLILDKIRRNEIKRYTVQMQKDLIRNAITAGRVKLEDLKEDVQKQVG